MKKDIDDQKTRKMALDTEAERTNMVLGSIKSALLAMLTRLQEMDEVTADLQAKRRVAKNLDFPSDGAMVNEATQTDQIVQMLKEKVKVGLIATGVLGDGEGIDSGLSGEEDEPDDFDRKSSIVESRRIKKPPDFSYSSTSQAPSSETAPGAGLDAMDEKHSEVSFDIEEKPPPYPQVYSSLITGRSTGLVSASPGAGGGKQTFSSSSANLLVHTFHSLLCAVRESFSFTLVFSDFSSPWKIVHYGDSLMISCFGHFSGSLLSAFFFISNLSFVLLLQAVDPKRRLMCPVDPSSNVKRISYSMQNRDVR